MRVETPTRQPDQSGTTPKRWKKAGLKKGIKTREGHRNDVFVKGQQMKRRAFSAMEGLEARSLMSAAPVIDAVDIGVHPIVAYQPFTFVVDASDDVAVIGVSLFMDRDNNGRWNPLVDQPLGDDFTRDENGKFSFTLTPDGSWPSITHLLAGAVDGEGQWSAVLGHPVYPIGMPIITMVSAHAGPLISIPESTPVTVRAIVTEPFRGGTSSAAGVTFFIDSNGNGRWDSGVDVDIGYSQEIDSGGAYTLTFYGGPIQGGTSIAAAARIADNRFDHSNGFGPVRVTPFNIFGNAPQIRNIVPENLSGRLGGADGPVFQVGDRVRFTIDVIGERDLQAVTVFYDANSNGRWDRGIDTDLGASFFAPDVFGGRARVDFTITPGMNFDYRAFVVAARYTGMDGIWDGGDYNWGATTTHWMKIISPAWLENVQVQPRDVQVDPIYVTFTARDDHAISRFFAFIDMNNNDQVDAGEYSTNLANRMSGSFTNGNWVMAIDVSGISTPGTYKLKLFANDFEDASRSGYSVDITI